MLKFKIKCTWLENNYNSNTCHSIENVAGVVQALRTKLIFAPKSVQTPVPLPINLVC
jgi:hypothetical protein